MSSTQRILGIDPGSRLVGYGLIEMEPHGGGPDGLRYVECGVIKPPTTVDYAARLCVIAAGLREVLDELAPTVAVVESVFQSRYPQSVLKLGQARGVALLCAAEAGLAVEEYTPARVKKAVTGNGRASKSQVQEMVRALMGLRRAPSADAADALAVAVCHAYRLRSEVLTRRRRSPQVRTLATKSARAAP